MLFRIAVSLLIFSILDVVRFYRVWGQARVIYSGGAGLDQGQVFQGFLMGVGLDLVVVVVVDGDGIRSSSGIG